MGGSERKAAGSHPGVVPRSGDSRPPSAPGSEDIFERLLRSAPKDLPTTCLSLAVEVWASQMWSIWAKSELIGLDAVEVFAGGLIKYGRGGVPRGADGAASPRRGRSRSVRGAARREAERLASAGVAERTGRGGWNWRATVAWLFSDPIDDDGVSVMVGFDGPAGPSTVGVYIDHNLDGWPRTSLSCHMRID